MVVIHCAASGPVIQNRHAGRIGMGSEDVVCFDRHEETITNWLLIVKPSMTEKLKACGQTEFAATAIHRGILEVNKLKRLRCKPGTPEPGARSPRQVRWRQACLRSS